MIQVQPTIDVTAEGFLKPGSRFARNLMTALKLEFEKTGIIEPAQIIEDTASLNRISLRNLRKVLVEKRGWLEVERLGKPYFYLTDMKPGALREQLKDTDGSYIPTGQQFTKTNQGLQFLLHMRDEDPMDHGLYQWIVQSNSAGTENKVEGEVFQEGRPYLVASGSLHPKVKQAIGERTYLKNIKQLKRALASHDGFPSGFFADFDSQPAKKNRDFFDWMMGDGLPQLVINQHLVLGPGAFQNVEIERDIEDSPWLNVTLETAWPRINQKFFLMGETATTLDLFSNSVISVDDRNKERPERHSPPPEPQEMRLPEKIKRRLLSPLERHDAKLFAAVQPAKKT